MRDDAELVGITERAVQRIVGELEEAGQLAREREGRRNHDVVRADPPLRHPMDRDRFVSSLTELVMPVASAKRKPRRG